VLGEHLLGWVYVSLSKFLGPVVLVQCLPGLGGAVTNQTVLMGLSSPKAVNLIYKMATAWMKGGNTDRDLKCLRHALI